ncbi:MAG TPA: hypothetical protein VFQ45_02315 [Longimicrobium sp.]|nr:hypothetical protein [Longimicrobium sp.]
MRKLKLDLDELEVQSFDTTTDPGAPRGTVHGAETDEETCEKSCWWGTCELHCSGGGTCNEPGPCVWTPDISCYQTCNAPGGPCVQDEG